MLLAFAGCGGEGGAHARELARGKAIFARSCSGCHTLTGHNTTVRGGDLAIARLSSNEIAGFVRVMPVRLDAPQVAAVAAYVHSAAGR
jgi:mono/diheme cytochrome c family protein